MNTILFNVENTGGKGGLLYLLDISIAIYNRFKKKVANLHLG